MVFVFVSIIVLFIPRQFLVNVATDGLRFCVSLQNIAAWDPGL